MLFCLLNFSAGRSHAHRRLHSAAAEWREELRCASEQAVFASCPYRHPCVHGHTRRPARHGEAHVCYSFTILIKVSGLPIETYTLFQTSKKRLCLKVFHKIITSGHQRLQPLYDCLLTIVVNGEY